MPPAAELLKPRHALIVATATYTDPGLASLRAPAQDAADMIDVLGDATLGCFTVTCLVDQPEPQIRRVVDGFLADRTPGDLVLIYLSCHGVLDPRGRLYFAATDTVGTRLPSTAVESGWLLDRLEDCRARQQVLILDCCFSGAFAGTKGATPGAEAELDLERRLIGAGRGRAVLTASRAGEYSYEGEPFPGVADRSMFTAALVEGIRTGKADINDVGYIYVDDAYAYAADRVNAAGAQQSPQHWLYGGEGKIILARSPGHTPVPPPLSSSGEPSWWIRSGYVGLVRDIAPRRRPTRGVAGPRRGTG
ncbi:MAG: caspase family protein [Micromonosporaceae bacterium]|nr:caspase family protein [Micromonosporaceae bacterium]